MKDVVLPPRLEEKPSHKVFEIQFTFFIAFTAASTDFPFFLKL